MFKNLIGKTVLIITHESPDIDAAASAIALKKLIEKNHRVTICFKKNKETEKVLSICKEKAETSFNEKVETLIVVDTNSLKAIKPFLKLAGKKILIDHHSLKKNILPLFDFYFVDEKATSASEIVYKILEKQGFNLDKKTATCLAAGIVTDSAFFKAANLETFLNLSKILEKNKINFEEVLNIIEMPVPISEKIAKLKGMQRLKIYRVKDFLIITTNASAFESSIASSLISLGADVVFVMNEKKIRIESKAKRWLQTKGFHLGRHIMPRAGEILEGEGGGHACAAGASGKKTENLDKALDKCVELTKKFLESMK